MNKDTVLGVVRHVLTFGGGFLVTKSAASADEVGQLVGALVTVVGVVWSIVSKRKSAPAA